jgi:carbamoyltransferase
MYVLGLWGGTDADATATEGGHDACAVLLADGVVIAGVEEERLCRIKHTRRAPLAAVQFCLTHAGVAPSQIEWIAIGTTEEPGLRAAIGDQLGALLGMPDAAERLVFVEHHEAHAHSAYAASGYDRALVATFDGMGDDLSGTINVGRPDGIRRLRSYGVTDSLGHLYLRALQILGYRLFDEYKVMGLAPYGDPARYRELVGRLYTLADGGHYRLHLERAACLREVGVRRKGEPFTQAHQDLAAAIQDALETIVLHVLGDLQRTTGERRLCLAGGVAHNCAMNGKLVRAGLFDAVFVQPAAHDAGTALGAALAAQLAHGATRPPRIEQVYWGPPLVEPPAIERTLAAWQPALASRRATEIYDEAAALLAAGRAIGWVQGRSEFGPRALGNRSILADPRPAENKARINEMVKKREGYRPFAPSVMVERAAEFFELPDAGAVDLSYMTFVVPVRAAWRAQLGAITHVDGTARIQTVARATNEPYWRLLEAFGRATGIPMLLNTSFNNHAEPIVDSVDDAIQCFLTTGLEALVIGEHVIEKRLALATALLELVPSQPPQIELRTSRRTGPHAVERRWSAHHEDAAEGAPDGVRVELSAHAHAILEGADGRPLRALLDELRLPASADLVAELIALWERRVVAFHPAPRR